MNSAFGIILLCLAFLLSCSPNKTESKSESASDTSVANSQRAKLPTGYREDSRGYPGDYPYLSYQEFTEEDVEATDVLQIRIMRNEIFARHGYIFKSEDLKAHFSSLPWYKPQFDNVDDKLTEIEKLNIKRLVAKEARNRYSPLGQIVRKLPFLTLPMDLMNYTNTPSVSPAPELAPDKSENWISISMYGLLPDTTRIFAMLWSGSFRNNFNLEVVNVFVTTFDKNMNPIETGIVRLTDEQMVNSSYCTSIGDATGSSVINSDWSYLSEFKQLLQCPDIGTGSESKREIDNEISGQIEKDGTIIQNIQIE